MRIPGADWLRFDGALTWDADDAANEIAAVFAHEQDIGYDARLLAASEVAAVTPGVDPAAIPPQGAIFNPGEGWVDLPALVRLLLQAFEAHGGRLAEHVGRVRVEVAGGRVTGAAAADGTRFEADAVLLAVGPWTPAVLAESGVVMPDATPISLLVKTKPAATTLRAVLNTPRVAVRPTPDGALVLDSAWSEEEVETREGPAAMPFAPRRWRGSCARPPWSSTAIPPSNSPPTLPARSPSRRTATRCSASSIRSGLPCRLQPQRRDARADRRRDARPPRSRPAPLIPMLADFRPGRFGDDRR